MGGSCEDKHQQFVAYSKNANIRGLIKVYALNNVSFSLYRSINNCLGAEELMEVLKGEQSYLEC